MPLMQIYQAPTTQAKQNCQLDGSFRIAQQNQYRGLIHQAPTFVIEFKF